MYLDPSCSSSSTVVIFARGVSSASLDWWFPESCIYVKPFLPCIQVKFGQHTKYQEWFQKKVRDVCRPWLVVQVVSRLFIARLPHKVKAVYRIGEMTTDYVF